MGYVAYFQVLVTNLVNPTTNYFDCFFFFAFKVNINVIIQPHTLGSLSCPGTDAYTQSTYIQSTFLSVLHYLSLAFCYHLPYI